MARAVDDPPFVEPPDDPQAFMEWVAPHLTVLAAVAARQVGVGDSADVVQETLVRAWRRRSTFLSDRGSVRAWLIGILLDQCRRWRKRQRHAVPTGFPPADVEAPSPQTVERVDVEQAVRSLPTRQREVIVLHYLADLSITETSTVLGISEGSVKSHLTHARRALRKQWEER